MILTRQENRRQHIDKNIDMKNKKNKENPLHLMKRLLGYILKNYKFSCIAVLV